MLYLNNNEVVGIIQDDLSIVQSALNKALQTMANGEFSLGGKHKASHGMRIDFMQNDTKHLFIAMPGYLGGNFNVAGLKWHGPMLAQNMQNRDSNYTLLLNNVQNGKPICAMCANALTDYRTAGVSFIAAKILAKKDANSLAIVGPGKINLILAKLLLTHFNIKEVYIKGRSEGSILNFKKELLSFKNNLNIKISKNIDEACQNADIVSINTGFNFAKLNDMPIIRQTHVKKGSVFLCSAFVYFPDKMIQNSHKIADLMAMYEEYEYELGSPVYKHLSYLGNRFVDLINQGKFKKDEIYDLSELISKTKSIENDDKIRLFSSGGISLFDIALGHEVYKIAKQKNIGINLEYD